jgi:hypothetical protein
MTKHFSLSRRVSDVGQRGIKPSGLVCIYDAVAIDKGSAGQMQQRLRLMFQLMKFMRFAEAHRIKACVLLCSAEWDVLTFCHEVRHLGYLLRIKNNLTLFKIRRYHD